jgi:hypothetical protein
MEAIEAAIIAGSISGDVSKGGCLIGGEVGMAAVVIAVGGSSHRAVHGCDVCIPLCKHAALSY